MIFFDPLPAIKIFSLFFSESPPPVSFTKKVNYGELCHEPKED